MSSVWLREPVLRSTFRSCDLAVFNVTERLCAAFARLCPDSSRLASSASAALNP
jgi:hypothetical protein